MCVCVCVSVCVCACALVHVCVCVCVCVCALVCIQYNCMCVCLFGFKLQVGTVYDKLTQKCGGNIHNYGKIKQLYSDNNKMCIVHLDKK